jgi:hypothetical protein
MIKIFFFIETGEVELSKEYFLWDQGFCMSCWIRLWLVAVRGCWAWHFIALPAHLMSPALTLQTGPRCHQSFLQKWKSTRSHYPVILLYVTLNENILIELEAFSAVTMKGTKFWDVNSCSPVEIHRRVGEKYRLHLQGRRASLLLLVLPGLLYAPISYPYNMAELHRRLGWILPSSWGT